MAFTQFAVVRNQRSNVEARIDFKSIPSPCFLLDEAAFAGNLDVLQNVQQEAGVAIVLALKSFAMWRAFPELKKKFRTAAASSFNEAKLCYEELGSRAHIYAPAFSKQGFLKILPYAGHITFNSFNQFTKFQGLASPRHHSLGIRINPGFSPVQPHVHNPCAPGSRLGVPIDDLPQILPNGLDGFHLHNLCESDSTTLEKVLDILRDTCHPQLVQIKWLNLGGGHLITGENYDTDHLISILRDFQKEYSLSLIFEPGVAFAWNAGFLVSKVLDIVKNHGTTTAILDISFAAHIHDCLDMPYRPKVLGQDPKNGRYAYRFGGNTCLASDYLETYRFNAPLQVGDTIVFEDMMHYTMVKSTFFNGIDHPRLGIWTRDGVFEMWKEFGYEDYKNRLS